VLVWPVRVQGDTSAAEVAAAIDGFNRLPEDGPLRRPDLIIVARGGGSLEDLWAFNEEIVVRAAAASFLPLISAIGHETDWTLIDYAADLRAPTPTGAAEKAVPVRLDLLTSLGDLERRHRSSTLRLLERWRSDVRGLARALPQKESLIAIPRQRMDAAGASLERALARGHDRQKIALARLSHRLAQQSPHAKIARVEQRLQSFDQQMRKCLSVQMERRVQHLTHVGARLSTARQVRLRLEQERLSTARKTLAALDQRQARGVVTTLNRAVQRFDELKTRLATAHATRLRVEQERLTSAHKMLGGIAQRQTRAFSALVAVRHARLQSLGQLLQSLGYRQVLGRGFALVRDSNEKPLRFATEIEDGVRLNLDFADGRKVAIAGSSASAGPSATAPKAMTGRPRKPTEQGSLF
jgi:exodeoxyribonuclease VII large subunit